MVVKIKLAHLWTIDALIPLWAHDVAAVPVLDQAALRALFYCADTITSRGGKAIPLEESIIKGRTQADKVNTIDKIWYIE